MTWNFQKHGVLGAALIHSLCLTAPSAPLQTSGPGAMAIRPVPTVEQAGPSPGAKPSAQSDRKLRLKQYKNPYYARMVDDAIIWLVAHQAEDGSWDARGFGSQCPKDNQCGAFGDSGQVIETTAMAVLALLGAGSDYMQGHHQQAALDGIRWLRAAQNEESGMIGLQGAAPDLRAHTLASLALIETYARVDNALIANRSIKAINAILSARNQQGTWANNAWDDGSDLTGLVLLTLRAALEVGLLDGHETVLDNGLAELLAQAGAESKSDKLSKLEDANSAIAALTLFCQIRTGAGGATGTAAATKLSNDLFGQATPLWLPEEPSVQREQDMYAWHFSAKAMFLVGGKSWKAWERQMRSALRDSQVKSGHANGSWKPFGSRAIRGGRVYATALMVLTSQTGSPHDPLQASLAPSGGLFPLSAVKPEFRPQIVD